MISSFKLLALLINEFQVKLFDILKQVEPVPGVQIQTGSSMMTPPDLAPPEVDEDSKDPDERHLGRITFF